MQMNASWPTRRLCELADIRVSNVDKKVHANEKAVKLCNYMDVYSNEYITDNIRFMNGSATTSETDRFGLELGDVIITKDSETPDDIGIPAVITEAIDNLVCGYHLALIRPDSDRLDSVYLAKQISTSRVAKYFGRHATGSTRYGLPTSAIQSVEIPVPPFAEQAKIAEILSTVDQAIERTEALITKQQRIKTGLIEDLLTRGIDEQGNLRSEETHRFKDSPLGRIPVEWDVVRLGSVSEIGSGLTLGNTYSGRNTVELPYLRVANVQDGYLDLAEVRTVQVPESDVRKYQLEVGDVLMNEGGDFDKLGRGSVWNGEIENCLHQNHVFRVRPMPGKLAPGYLSTVSASPYGKSFFILASKQSTNLASINSTQLKSFPIPLPEYGEQLRIEGVVRQSASTQEETGKQLRKLRSLKTGLMQDLLTGRVRVTALLSDSEVMG